MASLQFLHFALPCPQPKIGVIAYIGPKNYNLFFFLTYVDQIFNENATMHINSNFCIHIVHEIF